MSPPSTPHPPLGAAHDYRQFGRHRLRTPNGAIIDLPVTVARDARVWVAAIWPDPNSPGGWARQLWLREPTGRGWILPFELAGRDVVEFGADTPQQPVRWYGILNAYEVDRWTTLSGPYPHPADAWDDAQRQLATVRFEPLNPDPPTQPTIDPATEQPRAWSDRCRHHRPIRLRRGRSRT